MSINRLKELLSRQGLDSEAESEANKQVQHVEKLKGSSLSPALAGAAFTVGMTALVTFGGVGAPAAATEINTTAITDMITSMTAIFPSIGDMVVAIVPTLMILAIVGFILYFFDAILDAVQGAMRIFRR